MRQLGLFILCACAALAQNTPRQHNTFTVQFDDSPAAGASVLTIQQPATGSLTVEALWAKVYCSVDCVITLERSGTAATATAATEVGTTASTSTATVTAFSDSDVGNGTTVDKYTIEAGKEIAVDLTAYNLWLIGNGTTKNITLRSDSITGTVRMTLAWREW